MIIADTSFFVALANVRDRNHEVAVAAQRALRTGLVTTWPVLTETCHLLAGTLGGHAVERFVASVGRGAVAIHDVEVSDLGRVAALMHRYADLPMDLADASLVLLAEHLGRGDILSTDRRDFRTYRWKNRKPFRNLLPDV